MNSLDKMCVNYYRAGKRAAVDEIRIYIKTAIEFDENVTVEDILVQLIAIDEESQEIE